MITYMLPKNMHYSRYLMFIHGIINMVTMCKHIFPLFSTFWITEKSITGYAYLIWYQIEIIISWVYTCHIQKVFYLAQLIIRITEYKVNQKLSKRKQILKFRLISTIWAKSMSCFLSKNADTVQRKKFYNGRVGSLVISLCTINFIAPFNE